MTTETACSFYQYDQGKKKRKKENEIEKGLVNQPFIEQCIKLHYSDNE